MIYFVKTPVELLERKDVSLKAKGLFAYLESKPLEWKFSLDKIAEEIKEGKDSIRSAVKELEEEGYIRFIPKRDDEGKWHEKKFVLFYDRKSYKEDN